MPLVFLNENKSMKTVLIATDFSKAARNALVYGLQVAKEINANVILFNAYTVPTPAPALNVGVSRYDVKVQVDQKLKDEIKPLPLNMILENNSKTAIFR